MKSHGLKPPKYCISLSQINTHTTENSYSIYTLAVRRSFLCNLLGQFTRNYTQTTKRGLLTTNKG